MAKTVMELAVELVVAQIHKGLISCPAQTGQNWKARNMESIATTGRMVEEMTRELIEVWPKVKDPKRKRKRAPEPKIITAK